MHLISPLSLTTDSCTWHSTFYFIYQWPPRYKYVMQAWLVSYSVLQNYVVSALFVPCLVCRVLFALQMLSMHSRCMLKQMFKKAETWMFLEC